MTTPEARPDRPAAAGATPGEPTLAEQALAELTRPPAPPTRGAVVRNRLARGAIAVLGFALDHWGGVTLLVVFALLVLVFGPSQNVEGVIACACVGAAVAVVALWTGSL